METAGTLVVDQQVPDVKRLLRNSHKSHKGRKSQPWRDGSLLQFLPLPHVET